MSKINFPQLKNLKFNLKLHGTNQSDLTKSTTPYSQREKLVKTNIEKISETQRAEKFKINETHRTYQSHSSLNSHFNNEDKSLFKKSFYSKKTGFVIENMKKKIKAMIKNKVNSKDGSITDFIERDLKENEPKSQFIKETNLSRLKILSSMSQHAPTHITQNTVENPSMCLEYVKKNHPDSYNKEVKSARNNSNNFNVAFSQKKLKNFRIAIKRKDDLTNNLYTSNKKSISHQARMKLKWATIKWIINNRKESLSKLVSNHKKLLMKSHKIKDSNHGFTKSEFVELMKIHGISHDLNFISKVFWIFDIDGSGEIEYSEIVSGLEMFSESPLKNKVKAFFELCDVDNSGSIDKTELFNLMKKSIIKGKQRIHLKTVIDKIFTAVNNNQKELTFKEFLVGCEKNPQIYEIIENNINTLNTIDLKIEKDLKVDFMNFKPEADNRLRRVFNMPDIYYPNNEIRFEKILKEFIENKKEKKQNNIYFRGVFSQSDDLNESDSIII